MYLSGLLYNYTSQGHKLRREKKKAQGESRAFDRRYCVR
jgi:hypothetical protein